MTNKLEKNTKIILDYSSQHHSDMSENILLLNIAQKLLTFNNLSRDICNL